MVSLVRTTPITPPLRHLLARKHLSNQAQLSFFLGVKTNFIYQNPYSVGYMYGHGCVKPDVTAWSLRKKNLTKVCAS